MSSFLQSLSGLALADPWMLWLLPLVPLALLIRRWRGAPSVSFAPAPFVRHGPLPTGEAPRASPAHRALPRSLRARILPLPRILILLGLLLVTVALARPVRPVQLPKTAAGIDIYLCLDVSSSMAATDMDPKRSRLELAKAAAAQFVTGRPSDRIGLIRFARFPDVLCPLTLDHAALKEFLGSLQMVDADGLEDQTGIGTAVGRAAQVIRASLARSKVVILLTDGEENVATERTPDEIGPAKAARLCQGLGVRVYTIAAGIGKRDRSGNWVSLDTSQVRSLAEATGGEFFEARDAGAISRVYATIDQLEKVEFEEPRYELEDSFLPFLIAAIALICLGRILRATALEVLP